MIAEPEGGGIDVRKWMAWAFAYLTSSKFDGPPPGPLSADPGFYNRGTFNMKGLYAAGWYLYALLGNTVLAGALAVHRQRLLTFLRKLPHALGEPTTSTHGQLWCAMVSMVIWAAQKAGDEEMLAAAIAHKAVDYALWEPCRVEGALLDIWMPGARALQEGKLLGSNSARNAEYQIIRAYDPESHSWLKGRMHVGKNQYNVGPLALLACPGEIMSRIQQAPKALPPLYRALHVRRWADDFIAWYEPGLLVAGEGDAPAHVAGVLDGERWIEGPGGIEVVAKHLSRYPSTTPVLVLDVEGMP